jgi:uncharacterized protein YbbC (DUF1343 family)
MKIRLYDKFLIGFLFALTSINSVADEVPFKLGVENIPASLVHMVCPQKTKKTAVIGLITNQTGVDQKGHRTVDILQEHGFKVDYIFVPEHGLSGVRAGCEVHDSIDKKTKIPVVSLYGNGSGKMIQPEQIAAIDFLIFDIQDSGMRHYTYISTLLSTMKIAAEHDKPFVVLDRPNLLGSAMAGPLVDPELISFISIAPIPLRHGMTIGELAWYFDKHILEKKVKLHVIKMSGYDRAQGFVGDLIHQLSPNLQSLQSVYGYSFLGLLGEVEPFDVGVGTHMAFRCIALPDSMHVAPEVWQRLKTVLSSFGVKGVPYHHINKKNKRSSKGLRLEFSAMSDVRSFELFIAILQFFKKENIPFSFSASFNKAVGSKDVQEVIAGTLSETEFFDRIARDLQQFHKRVHSSFFYSPAPVISMKEATSKAS